jgi:hypothetical protein
MRSLAAICIPLIVIGCGGSSPTQPNPNPTPSPQPSAWTIGGTVTTTLSGEPVAGASLAFSNGDTATTNAAGQWTLTRSSAITSKQMVEVTAQGYLARRVYVNGSETSRSVSIDMIRDAAPFSLAFYRQVARRGFEAPDELRGLNRWTRQPSFYIDTTNPRGGQLSAEEIALVSDAIRTAVPQATGGMFSAGPITTGSGSRPAAPGVIVVSFLSDSSWSSCARATVGGDTGTIEINYGRCEGVCGSNSKIARTTMLHEVGHTMGLYHAPGGMMDANTHACGLSGLSETEQHHAKFVYARPVGNADLDWDQPTSAFLQAPGAKPFVVQCYR